MHACKHGFGARPNNACRPWRFNCQTKRALVALVAVPRHKTRMVRQPIALPLKSSDHMLALEKGLAVIESFDGHEELTVSQVAGITGLSRAAARRCLFTLTALNYASFDGKAFRLAPRVLRLGYSYLSKAELPHIVQPALERLSAALSESCSCAVLEGTEVLYVARAATKRIISVDLTVGSRLPAYCNAMGRVLLAAMPVEEARAILRRSELIQRTPRTRTKINDLLSELRTVAKQGYSIVEGELELGLLTIAVPLIDATGKVVAAVNVGNHVDRTTPKLLIKNVLPLLRDLQQSLRPLMRS